MFMIRPWTIFTLQNYFIYFSFCSTFGRFFSAKIWSEFQSMKKRTRKNYMGLLNFNIYLIDSGRILAQVQNSSQYMTWLNFLIEEMSWTLSNSSSIVFSRNNTLETLVSKIVQQEVFTSSGIKRQNKIDRQAE